MSDNKSQHFVPRLYLKTFSLNKNGKEISLFNVTNNFYVKNAKLKHQAQEDFFYGKDGVTENILQKIESQAAPILNKMILNSSIPKMYFDEFISFFNFSFLLAYRTKNEGVELQEMLNNMFKLFTKNDPRMSKYEVSDLELRINHPGDLNVSLALQTVRGAYDLKIKLLYNTTNIKFIASDNPVIKYNQYLEKRNHLGGHTGVANKGLQLFFPISPEIMLVFYDEWAYKVGNKKDDSIELTNNEDIDKLNMLQLINCFKIAYFNEKVEKEYLTTLNYRVAKYRGGEYTVLNELKNTKLNKENQKSKFYETYKKDIKINLTLSFIKETKKAKNHIISNYVTQLRNENLRPRRNLNYLTKDLIEEE